MASRILANLIVSGGQVLLRAAAAAYQKALVSACPPFVSRHATTARAESSPIPARLANRHRTQPGADLPFRSSPADAQRSGVANEAAKGGAASMFSRKTMSIEEARSILGVDAQCTLEDVTGRYAKMFKANEKNGSFYLQSKIHRAKERMEAEFLGEGGDGDRDARAGDGADAAGDAEKNPNAGRGFAAGGVEDAPKK